MSPAFAAPSDAQTPARAPAAQEESPTFNTQSDTDQKAQCANNPTMMSIAGEGDATPASPSAKDKAAQNNKRIHPVTGYGDSENMWQKLASMERDNVPNLSKYPNNKSAFIVQV